MSVGAVEREPRNRDGNPDFSLLPKRDRAFFGASANQRFSTVWRPEAGPGQFVGLVLAGLSIVVLIATLQLAAGSTGFLRLLLSLVALAALSATVLTVTLVIRLRSILYTLGDEGLILSAAGYRLIVDWADVDSVIFRPRDVITVGGHERFWPGFIDADVQTSEGRWRSLATTAPRDRVRIRLRNGLTVAISPARPVLFVEALESFRRPPASSSIWHGPESGHTETSETGTLEPFSPELQFTSAPSDPQPPPARRPRSDIPLPFAYRLFRDRIVRGDLVTSHLLALCLIFLVALTMMAAWKADSVTRPLAVKWNPDGEPSWFVRPDGPWLIDGVWIYPATAAAIIVVNTGLATLLSLVGRTAEMRLLLTGALACNILLLIAMARTTGLI